MRGRRRRRYEIVYRRLGAGEDLSRRQRYGKKRSRKWLIFIGIAVVVVLFAAIIGCGFAFRKAKPVSGEDVSGNVEIQAETQTAGSIGEADISATGTAEGTETNTDVVWDYSTDDRPKVKGIYVTGPMAGSGGFEELLTLVDETELNAMVIDVKNDNGEITYQMDQETAASMGACISYIRDMDGFMSRLKEHGVYTIARIVCFKDPYLAKNYPELALTKPDGTPVVDGNGLAWVNPYEEEVWEYLVDVAKAAAEMGFDEIQFDYVRFPIGSDAEAADYGVDMAVYTKQQAITGFLNYAAEELHSVGVPVTADVFGTIIGSQTDVEQVGQDYAALGEVLDVVCPMVYPSHYGNNVFGLSVPDAQPYETVFAAMTGSAEVLAAIPEEQRAVVRPWLQAFTATWVDGHTSYGGEQIRAQIQAVYDAGYEEWILWNASNRYSEDGLLLGEQ
ncbi:MAG: putative glycoside hydrolase [Lachnospiraceae bacterium]